MKEARRDCVVVVAVAASVGGVGVRMATMRPGAE